MSPTHSAITRLKQRISREADAWGQESQALREKTVHERERLRDQQQRLIRMKMDQLINDEEFMAQRAVLSARIQELDGQEDDTPIDSESMVHFIDEICVQLMDLGSAWQSVHTEMKRRFQLLALPQGFVVGRVATAQRGRLFEVLTGLRTSKTDLVPLAGHSWNQLANEIEAFAALFSESSMSQEK